MAVTEGVVVLVAPGPRLLPAFSEGTREEVLQARDARSGQRDGACALILLRLHPDIILVARFGAERGDLAEPFGCRGIRLPAAVSGRATQRIWHLGGGDGNRINTVSCSGHCHTFFGRWLLGLSTMAQFRVPAFVPA